MHSLSWGQFHKVTPTNNGVFNFKIHIWLLKQQNVQIKCQNGQQKGINWQHVALYLLPKIGNFTQKKTAGVKACMKLTLD